MNIFTNSFNVLQIVGFICITYSLLQIIFDRQMILRIKIALLVSCMVSTGVICCELMCRKNYMLSIDGLIFWIAMKYVLMALFPVAVLSALEYKAYINTVVGAVTFMLISMFMISLIWNFFYPVYFDVIDYGRYVNQGIWWIRSLMMFAIYAVSLGIVFHRKYTLGYEETSGIIMLGVMFIACVFWTDIEFHGDVLGMFSGLAVLILTNIFHTLSAKTCPITSLPYVDILKKRIGRVHIKSNLLISKFIVNGLDEINSEFGRTLGNKYFYATVRTVSEKLKPYGSLYRCVGNKFIFIGKDTEKLHEVLNEIRLTEMTSKKFGEFGMNIEIETRVYKPDEAIELKKYCYL